MTVLLGMSASSLPHPAEAYPPVPVPRAEVVPATPGPRYIWRPGHWYWDGRDYVWHRGVYIERRPAYHAWVPGHWGPRGRWIPAHWR